MWQWNNISAVLRFARFSQEELEDKLNENDQTIKNAMDAVPEVTIRDITQEEKDALRDGTLTQEELVESLIQKPKPQPQEKEPKPEKPPQTKPEQVPNEESPSQSTQQPAPEPAVSNPEQEPEQEPEQSQYEQQVNALIAQVLVLREEFLIKLDELKAAAIADYKAIPEDQRTKTKLLSLTSGYMSKGLALEKQCDAQIEAIVAELDRLARENGGDLTLAQTVYDTYVEEKSLKKAWYMAELKKGGMT